MASLRLPRAIDTSPGVSPPKRHQNHSSSTPTVTNSRQLVQRNKFHALVHDRPLLQTSSVCKSATYSSRNQNHKKHNVSCRQTKPVPTAITRNTWYVFSPTGKTNIWSLCSLRFWRFAPIYFNCRLLVRPWACGLSFCRSSHAHTTTLIPFFHIWYAALLPNPPGRSN